MGGTERLAVPLKVISTPWHVLPPQLTDSSTIRSRHGVPKFSVLVSPLWVLLQYLGQNVSPTARPHHANREPAHQIVISSRDSSHRS